MELIKDHADDALNLTVKGRLDGYWADHLAKELAEILRDGVHQVRLDLSDVSYMSSAGIGTLIHFYKEFKAIHGAFSVVRVSAQVRTLLSLTKLDTLLIAEGTAAATTAA